MFIVLHEPEIPPNTGNIARLCAAFAVELHLIEPLGFKLENRYLKRAGLDYWPHVKMRVWPGFAQFARANDRRRFVLATTKASLPLPEFHFHADDCLIFGPETRGLPDAILRAYPDHVRIPMRKMEQGGARSLNLSSACAIMLYAAMTDCGLVRQFF